MNCAGDVTSHHGGCHPLTPTRPETRGLSALAWGHGQIPEKRPHLPGPPEGVRNERAPARPTADI